MDVEAWTARVLAGCPRLRAPEFGAGPKLARIIAAALAAVDPHTCVSRHVHLLRKPKGEALIVGEFVFDLGAQLHERERVWIFGAGKASAAMAAALRERLADRIAGGLVIVKHAPDRELGPIEWAIGDHPIPGPATARASARLRELARQVGPRDLVLCPISGGASALLSEPLLPAAWLTELTAQLLRHDVSIQAINKLRRRFDALKAGGLARMFAPATVVSLIISDVVGDELALVGSGPTIYPTHDEAAAYEQLLRELEPRMARLPDELRRQLANPTPLREAPPGHDVHHVLVARNADAREAACRAARAEGFDSLVLLPALGGLACDEGHRLGRLLVEMPRDIPIVAPACLVMGGETTVALELEAGETGQGGRNLELALAAAEVLQGHSDVVLVTLATDGEDGPTDAAGAIVTGESFAQLVAAGIDGRQALARHDSLGALERIDAVLRIGPTGTNVCDLALLFRLRPATIGAVD